MSWGATALVVGATSSYMSSQHAKKMAAKQSALARQQAKKVREAGRKAAMASEHEIRSLRILRSLDVPAFKQASEQAMIQAQKGAERMQRQRMMGRLAPDVRQAIFGGQFQQYVGREQQRFAHYAGMTEKILRATERQQQMALQVEQTASGMEYSGQSQAIQMEAAAGDTTANMLGIVAQATSQYAMAQSAKAGAAKQAKEDFWKMGTKKGWTPEDIQAKLDTRADFLEY